MTLDLRHAHCLVCTDDRAGDGKPKSSEAMRLSDQYYNLGLFDHHVTRSNDLELESDLGRERSVDAYLEWRKPVNLGSSRLPLTGANFSSHSRLYT